MNLNEALGAAYVLEGSTLGGQVIRRALQKHPVLSDQCQFHYYNCYGEHLRTRWLNFIELADQTLLTPIQIDMACQSACQTFELACEVFAESFKTFTHQNTSEEVLV
jgi:heme oxygenase